MELRKQLRKERMNTRNQTRQIKMRLSTTSERICRPCFTVTIARREEMKKLQKITVKYDQREIKKKYTSI